VFTEIKALALGKTVRHNQLRKIKLKSLERPETLLIAIAPFPLLIQFSGEIDSLENIFYSSRVDDWNASFFFGIWLDEFS
jgi:hypothetical protein